MKLELELTESEADELWRCVSESLLQRLSGFWDAYGEDEKAMQRAIKRSPVIKRKYAVQDKLRILVCRPKLHDSVINLD